MNDLWWAEAVCVGLRVFYVDQHQTVIPAWVVSYDEDQRTLNLAMFVDREPPVVREVGIGYAPVQRDGSLIPWTWHL